MHQGSGPRLELLQQQEQQQPCMKHLPVNSWLKQECVMM
jgi:hypothetical protein